MFFYSLFLKKIVVVLIIGSALSAAVGGPVILQDFSDSSRYTLREAFAAPSLPETVHPIQCPSGETTAPFSGQPGSNSVPETLRIMLFRFTPTGIRL